MRFLWCSATLFVFLSSASAQDAASWSSVPASAEKRLVENEPLTDAHARKRAALNRANDQFAFGLGLRVSEHPDGTGGGTGAGKLAREFREFASSAAKLLGSMCESLISYRAFVALFAFAGVCLFRVIESRIATARRRREVRHLIGQPERCR